MVKDEELYLIGSHISPLPTVSTHYTPDPARTPGYSIGVRKETSKGWRQLGRELRLVNRDAVNWTGALPGERGARAQLKGDILRFGDDS